MKESRKTLESEGSPEGLDWMAAASLVAERTDRPLAILDNAHIVRLVNRPFMQVMACRSTEVVDRSWLSMFLAPPDIENAEHMLRSVQQGMITQAEMPVVTCDSRRLLLSLEMQRIGTGDSGGILMFITSTRVSFERRWDNVRDLVTYEISVAPNEFGILVAGESNETGLHPASREHCYERLFQRSSPCPGCPAQEPMHIDQSRESVQLTALRPNEYVLVKATRVSATKARMTAQFVEHGAVRLIIQARLEFLAESARLSARERDVLTSLVLSGDSMSVIAAQLGISVGTVKFHVNNILRKLGADSRVDLVRLLF